MTSYTKTRFKRGEIWVAKLLFLDNPNHYKIRPVIVAANPMDDDVLIIPVTSAQARSEFDVFLEHWKSSGLIQASWARTSKITPLNQIRFIKQIGILHKEDCQKVLEMCRILFI